MFACRLFAIQAKHIIVAPYDMAFIEARGMTEPPIGDDIQEISFQEFEALWDDLAQPRLHMFANVKSTPPADAQVLYVKSPFPDSFKSRGEPTSDIYTEWANRVARRHFEVFPNYTVIASHDPDLGWPEHFEIMTRAIELGMVDDTLIDPRLRPVSISHADFETLWEQHALKRLRSLSGLAGS